MSASAPATAAAATTDQTILPDLIPLCREALAAAETYGAAAREAVGGLVMTGPKVDPARLEAEQFAAHGFAWTAAYVAALRELLHWAERLDAAGRLGETERLILQIGYGEYLGQLAGGVAISQGEIVRPDDMGVSDGALEGLRSAAAETLIRKGNTNAARMRLAELIAHGDFGDTGLDDEMLVMIRDQFRRFAEDKVVPHAHAWHQQDVLIPMAVIEELAELGIFGLTIPEENGGLGLGKVAMCVVTEEL